MELGPHITTAPLACTDVPAFWSSMSQSRNYPFAEHSKLYFDSFSLLYFLAYWSTNATGASRSLGFSAHALTFPPCQD